jgi:hypothetical protein
MSENDFESNLKAEAENAASYHFRDGRDQYEKFAEEVIEMIFHPKHGLTPEQFLGPFLRGIALNNFYYGYLAAKGVNH